MKYCCLPLKVIFFQCLALYGKKLFYFENIFEYKNFDIRSTTELDKQLLRWKYVFLFLVLIKMVIYQPLFTNQC